jgi:hypothetical protein
MKSAKLDGDPIALVGEILKKNLTQSPYLVRQLSKLGFGNINLGVAVKCQTQWVSRDKGFRQVQALSNKR